MKSTPHSSIFYRSVPAWAAAFLAVCLCAAPAAAQATSATAPDRSTQSPSASGVNSGVNDDMIGTRSAAGATSDVRGTAEPAQSGMAAAERSGESLKRSDRRFLSKAAEDNHKEIAISQLAAERASNPEVRSYAQQIASEHRNMSQELVQLAQKKGVELENAASLTTSAMGGGARSVDANRSMSGSGVSDSTNAGVATTHGAPRATGPASTASTPAATGIPTNQSTATSAPTSGAARGTAGAVGATVPQDVQSDRHYRNLSRKEGAEFDKSYMKMMVDQHEADVKLFERAAKEAEDSEVRSFASRHLPSLQQHLQRATNLSESAVAE